MTIMSSNVTNKQLSSTIYRTWHIWHNQRSSSINARKQRIESKRRPSPVEQHLDTDTQPQTCGWWRCCRSRGGEDHIEYWPETRVARPGQHGHHGQHQHPAQGRHGRYCQLPGYGGYSRARIQWIAVSGYNEGKSVLLQRKHLLYAAWRHFPYHHSDEGQWVTHAARTQEDNFKTLEC